jgi:hypothetical protein
MIIAKFVKLPLSSTDKKAYTINTIFPHIQSNIKGHPSTVAMNLEQQSGKPSMLTSLFDLACSIASL